MNQTKIRVGILLDSFSIPAWAFHALEKVVRLNCVDFVVIVLNGFINPGQYNPNLFYKNNHNLAYRILSRIDQAIFHRGPDAFAPKNAQGLFPNVPIIRIDLDHNEETGNIPSSGVDKINCYKIDILIRMGFENLAGDIFTAAKYGVWTYYHGDPQGIRSNQPGFWEVANGDPETGCILYIMNNDAIFGKVLYRSSIQTYPLSPVRNRNRCFWKSSSILSRQIELLYRLGENDFFSKTEKYKLEFDSYTRKEHKSPSCFITLWVYMILFSRAFLEVFHRAFYRYYWYLMFDINDIYSFSFANYRKIIPPKDRYWADPHMIRKKDNYYIFIEEYLYKNGKGHISVIQVDLQGHCTFPLPVLIKDYHLSYPYVFEHDDRYYMVPESSQNNSIDLYECVEFPNEWKFKMTLMSNIKAVDTTLFFYQDEWWLFTGITENEGAFPEIELYLFYSDKLFTTEWKSHELNPVITDVTTSRPAGRLFLRNGKIYRPSQDCSKLYGYGFNVNEVQVMTHADYCEKKVAVIKPDWDPTMIATHTYTTGDRFTVIDGFTRRSKII